MLLAERGSMAEAYNLSSGSQHVRDRDGPHADRRAWLDRSTLASHTLVAVGPVMPNGG